MQQWRHSFVDLGLIWMEVLGKQINKWVLSAVAKDKVTTNPATLIANSVKISLCHTHIHAHKHTHTLSLSVDSADPVWVGDHL